MQLVNSIISLETTKYVYYYVEVPNHIVCGWDGEGPECCKYLTFCDKYGTLPPEVCY